MGLLNTDSNNNADNVSIAAGIFAEHSDFIYATLCYKARNKDQVDDLYQDFFLSLVSNPPSSSIRSVKSYIYKAITNDTIDSTRKMQRYQNMKKKYADYLNFSVNKKSLKNAPINEGLMDGILKLIRGKLTSSEIRAITLRYRDGCSVTEVAEKMNVKKESVSRYVSVGLKKIRRYLNVNVKRGNSQ